VFDSALHVPLLIRHPGKVAAGPASAGVVSLVDVFPTVLAAIGDQTPGEGLHGRSLFESIESWDAVEDRTLLAEYSRPVKLIHEYWRNRHPEADLSRFDVSLKAARRGKYKYVLNGRGEAVMYDLEADPGETRDISAGLADEAAAMRKQLGDLLSGSGAVK
jgi:arylsulfatase A-like enzyme